MRLGGSQYSEYGGSGRPSAVWQCVTDGLTSHFKAQRSLQGHYGSPVPPSGGELLIGLLGADSTLLQGDYEGQNRSSGGEVLTDFSR